MGREVPYMADAVARGHISGDGEYTRRCQELLRSELDCPAVFLTTSGTHALELAAMLLDLEPGDEVLVPDFTFVSTANAFALRGARPLFVDIRADTLNLDESALEEKIGPRTRAVVPVHYSGIGCEMTAIGECAARNGLTIVEDNAHGLFAQRKGRLLGTLGSLAALSFHETKNFTCGEGGALIVNDPSLVSRAEILREKGTNRRRFFRGEVDKYTWVDLGSSWLPSDLLAAFLLAQLEEREQITAARRRIFECYAAALASWASNQGVQLPTVPDDCVPSYHMFYMVMPTPEARTRLIEHLKTREILAVFHYQPLHLSEMGKRWGGRPGDCPVSESVSDRLVRLPFYTGLSASDQERVIETVLSVFR